MNKNFDFLNNSIEVRLVRNNLLQKQLDSERKAYPLPYHILFSLLCAFAVYFGFDGAGLGIGRGLCEICLIAAPGLLTFNLLYSPKYLKFLPPVLAALLCATRLILTRGVGFIDILLSALSFCLIFACSAAMVICVKKGYTKNGLFAAISAIYAIILLSQMALLFYEAKGTISFSAISTSVDSFFNSVSSNAIKTIDEQFSLTQMQAISGYAKDVSKETILKDLTKQLDFLLASFKMFLPSIFAIVCIVYSFLTVAVFSVIARIFKIDVFVCIMDEWWTYRPSIISIRFYDILFFFFIITLFFNIPQNISAAIKNLFIILTPMIYICALRLIWQFFSSKTKSNILGFVITAAITIFTFFVMSGISFFLIASVGTALMSARDRTEKLVLPIKLLQEKEALENDTPSKE